jgi:hypothetical protein
MVGTMGLEPTAYRFLLRSKGTSSTRKCQRTHSFARLWSLSSYLSRVHGTKLDYVPTRISQLF